MSQSFNSLNNQQGQQKHSGGFQPNQTPNKPYKTGIIITLGVTTVALALIGVRILSSSGAPEQTTKTTQTSNVETKKSAFYSTETTNFDQTIESTTQSESQSGSQQETNDPGYKSKGTYTSDEQASALLTDYPITRATQEEPDFTKRRLMVLFDRSYDRSLVTDTIKTIESKGISVYVGIYQKETDNQVLLQEVYKYSYKPAEAQTQGFYYDGGTISGVLKSGQDPLAFLKEVAEHE